MQTVTFEHIEDNYERKMKRPVRNLGLKGLLDLNLKNF